VRAEIFRIHLDKRDLDPAGFDLACLSAASEGFTGAEIEEAIVSARYLAGSRSEAVRQEDVLAAINRTYPMSIMRAESIAGLRAWAAERTVKA
jgi:ATP-dependent 26S proteasome regulatory subunit